MKIPGTVLTALFVVWLAAGCAGLPPGAAFTATGRAETPNMPAPTAAAPSASPTVRNTPADFPLFSPTAAGENLTPGPSSTPLAFEASATASPSPSSTPGPTNTPYGRATRTPTITPTPPIPNAGVQFAEPGPMSKVISPLHLIANIRSVPSGTYRVELIAEPLRPGEAPRQLYREVQRIISNPVDWVYLDEEIQFELSRVSEFAQLRVSVFDQYDRAVWVNSVDLLLLSMGPNEITPSNVRSEPIVIRQPSKNQLIQGGTVVVSGLARPSEEFMLVELVAADGSVPGYRQVFVSGAADGSYVPFAVEVPYSVAAGTWVRLQVSESSTRIEGVEQLASVEVYLSP